MSLSLVHGPFYLTAGQHVHDEPSQDKDNKPIRFKVKAVEPLFVVDDKDRKWAISRMAHIHHDGREHTMYRGEVKVVPGALVPGDEVTLATEKIYGAPDVPERLRKQNVQYKEFMANVNCLLLNSHNAIKYVKANDKAQADEITLLRQERQRLLDQIAQQAEQLKQQAPSDDKNQQGKQQPALAGKR